MPTSTSDMPRKTNKKVAKRPPRKPTPSAVTVLRSGLPNGTPKTRCSMTAMRRYCIYTSNKTTETISSRSLCCRKSGKDSTMSCPISRHGNKAMLLRGRSHPAAHQFRQNLQRPAELGVVQAQAVVAATFVKQVLLFLGQFDDDVRRNADAVD